MQDANPEIAEIPAWPVVPIELGADGSARVEGDPVPVAAGEDPRAAAVRVVAATARIIGRPVRAEAREADGTTWPLIVTPDGAVVPAGPGRPPAPAKRRTPFASRRRNPRPAAPATPDRPGPTGAPGPSARPAPGRWPAPDEAERAILRRVEAELRGGRTASAEAVARELAAHGADPAREVLAYVAFVAGDAAEAAVIYAELALAARRADAPDGGGPHAERLAGNARLCLRRVSDPDRAAAVAALVDRLGPAAG